MSTRLLMVALDGADGALLGQWSADGTLPNLTALRADGAMKRLCAPGGATDDALWASFKYASGLGEHGRYHWRQRLNSGTFGKAYLDEANRDSFWETLSGGGLRVAVFDLPKCGLPRPINGIHLADWLVHGRYFDQPKSYPEALASEVVERFGPAPPSRCGSPAPAYDDTAVRDVLANLRTSVARKRTAGIHYLASEPWDLFMIAFKEAHCAGHHMWDLADPNHTGYDPGRANQLGQPFRSILMDIDAAVGELVSAAGEDAAVVVFSTTDMAPNSTLSHLMPEVVKRVNRRLGDNLLTRATRYSWRRLTGASSGPPCEHLPYNENCTALRVNPKWQVRFDREVDQTRKRPVLKQIESMLWDLTDVDTGRQVVHAIDQPSVEHSGTRAALLPDLLLRFAPGTIPTDIFSPRLGRIELKRPDLRPGNHTSGGILICSGLQLGDVAGMEDLGKLAGQLLDAEAI